jgi:WD40 repeat protein
MNASSFQMGPLLIPNVAVLVARRAPVMIANGGDAPIPLGAWQSPGSPSGFLHIWNWSQSSHSRLVRDSDGKPVKRPVPSVLTDDGRFAAWETGDVLDLQTGRWSTVELPRKPLQILALRQFSPDGTRLACELTNRVAGTSAEFDGQFLQIREFPSGQPLGTFEFQDQNFFRFCFGPDGVAITAIDRRGLVVRREVATGRVLREHAPRLSGQVMSLEESPDGRFLAGVELSGDAWVWDVSSGELRHRIPGATLRRDDGDFLRAVRFSLDGRYLAVSSMDRLPVVEVTSGEIIAFFSESFGVDLRWSDDGQEITVISPATIGELPTDGDAALNHYDIYPSVHVWDWRKGELVRALTAEAPRSAREAPAGPAQ